MSIFHQLVARRTIVKSTRGRATLALLLAASLCCGLCSVGCDDTDTTSANITVGQEEDSVPSEQAFGEDAPNKIDNKDVELVTVTEPTESAFTVKMPNGWENDARLVKVNGLDRSVLTSVKPGGDAFLFFGDPKIPAFTVPTPELNENSQMAKFNPTMKFAQYKPAETFFTEYVKKKFGKMPGFQIIGTEPNPRLEELVRAQSEKAGMKSKYTTTTIAFDYMLNDKHIHAMINGVTLSVGTIWMADISGVSTTGDPSLYKDLVMQIAESYKTNPEWQARKQALSRLEHERTMDRIQANTDAMTRQHERNMAGIQASAQRHQARMDAIHAAGDAQMSNWKAQQDQTEVSHNRFKNYINGEETVVTPNGTTHQVQTGQGRYFLNKNDNTYIGMDSTKDAEDLRKVWGLNPDNYEEGKIKP